MRCRSCRSGA